MADQTLTRLLAKARAGHAGRSEAYRWLRAKFDRLYPLLDRRILSFKQVAEDLAASGKLGGGGKPITAHAARDIWNRVRRDVANEEPWRMEAAQIAMRHGKMVQKPLSRAPSRGVNADQPPPIVAIPAPRPPVPSYPPPQSRRPKQEAIHSRPNASSNASEAPLTSEEILAHLTATINRRSGRR